MIRAAEDIHPRFIDILLSWSSPLFLILFILIVVILILYFIKRYLLIPTEQKHIQEKKEIELKNSRMMALFSELDPDPVIRVNLNGNIIFFNEAAGKLFSISEGSKLPDAKFRLKPSEIENIINKDNKHSFQTEINGIHYNVLIIGNSHLGIAQIYLRDISAVRSLELKLKQLSNHLQNQLDEERFRIAHELHDGIVQELYLVQMGINKVEEASGLAGNEVLESVKLQLRAVSEELRRLIYNLKPKVLDELGLEPALKTLVNNVINETGISGSVDILGIGTRLDKKLEIYFYRIIQEALSNIIRHSGASEFSVFLMKDNGTIRAIITDNGCGLVEDTTHNINSGFGLINMKERTEALGGIIKLDSTLNEGLTLIAEIPIKNRE